MYRHVVSNLARRYAILINLEFWNGIEIGEDRRRDDARKERKRGNLLSKFRGQITHVHAGSLHIYRWMIGIKLRNAVSKTLSNTKIKKSTCET